MHPQLQFTAEESSVAYLLNTTDDNVVETPDETLVLTVYIPGMFPSFLGDLVAVVSIEVTIQATEGDECLGVELHETYCTDTWNISSIEIFAERSA